MKTNIEQFIGQLHKASHSLVVIPDHCDNEIACAGLGIFHYAKAHGKEASIVACKKLDPRLAFLPDFDQIQKSIEHARNFVLSFDVSQNEIKDVRYERAGSNLNIYITPKYETISPRDFSFAPGQFMYDLVVVLGTTELQNIGTCYEKNADLFFEVPIVNIDFHMANEQFGQLNIVEVKTSGVSELAADLLLANGVGNPTPLEQKCATCLYAGILEATESFQLPRTTPRTLTTAAKLIDSGADHKQIVRHLYKTEDLSTIRLWGRLMMRMRYQEDIKLAWTTAQLDDFDNGIVHIEKLRAIFDKIRSSYRKADMLLLLWEAGNNLTQGCIQNANKDLLKQLLGGIDWGNAVIFELHEPLNTAQEKVLKILNEGYRVEG